MAKAASLQGVVDRRLSEGRNNVHEINRKK